VRSFYVLELPHQVVEFGVTYFGGVQDVVKMLVTPDLVAQLFDFLLGTFRS